MVDRLKSGRKRKLDGKQEAFLVALACSDAPEEREHWSLRMLSDALLKLGAVDAPVSYETVRDCLQKNELKPWLKQPWCIPTVGADFVWRMEDVLGLYAELFKPCLPIVRFDERPCILRADTCPSLSMKPGQLTRQDYENEIFLSGKDLYPLKSLIELWKRQLGLSKSDLAWAQQAPIWVTESSIYPPQPSSLFGGTRHGCPL